MNRLLAWLGWPQPDSRADRFIARFEDDLARAETQEDRDNAEGRLRYWRKVRG